MGDTTAAFGNTGEGKTKFEVISALQAKAAGRPVYLNHHVRGINCSEIVPGRFPSEYPPSPYYLESPKRLIYMSRHNLFPRNSFVGIDEAYAWGLDARETMKGDQDSKEGRLALTHSILQSRKAHYQILHTEQLIRSIDNRLRFLTEYYVLMRGTSYTINEYNEKENVEFRCQPYQNLGIFGFREMPPMYIDLPVNNWVNRYYDTFEQVSYEQEIIMDEEKGPVYKEVIVRDIMESNEIINKILGNKNKTPEENEMEVLRHIGQELYEFENRLSDQMERESLDEIMAQLGQLQIPRRKRAGA